MHQALDINVTARNGDARSTIWDDPDAGVLEVRRVGFRRVIVAHGDVDDAHIATLRSVFMAAVKDGGCDVWIDLSDTTAIAPCPARALIGLDALARRLDRELAVICPPGPLRRELENAGPTLEIHDDLWAAHRSR
jgi:anti-anti-sigma regulatory factor